MHLQVKCTQQRVQYDTSHMHHTPNMLILLSIWHSCSEGRDGKAVQRKAGAQTLEDRAFYCQAHGWPKILFIDRLSLYSSLYICLLKCQHPSLYIHTCMSHIVLWTYHLIKNRICPSISVAPRISSATSPLRNPLGSLGSGTSTLLLWFSPMCREVIGLISCNTVTYNFQAVAQHTQVCVHKKFTGFQVNIKWKAKIKEAYR